LNDSSKIEKGELQDYTNYELVVETDQLNLVANRLGQNPRWESDVPLGLTRLQFAGTKAVEEAVRAVQEQRQAAGAAEPPRVCGDRSIERLLGELRALFQHMHAGWVPTMGKNRLVRGVELYPYARGGGEGTPVDLSTKDLPVLPGPSGRRVRVGVLDTRLYENPVLDGRYTGEGGSLVPDEGLPRHWWNKAEKAALAGHATFIAGVILQRAGGAELDVRHALNDHEATATAWDVGKKIAQFASSGVEVLNLSFGCFTDDARPPLVLVRAVERLVPHIVIVAAAGNHGTIRPADQRKALGDAPAPSPIFPAAMADVVAVGATEGSSGRLAPFNPKASENGTGADRVAPWIDLVAPGVDIRSTFLNERVKVPDGNGRFRSKRYKGAARWSGTSFAAAAVTGAIAADAGVGARDAAHAVERLRNRAASPASADIWAP
jgi:membrane-anchored mycosin MYCP